MFYTLQDLTFGTNSDSNDRFICFEAGTVDEAVARAEWFGIDLTEQFVESFPTRNRDRWKWIPVNMRNLAPRVGSMPIEYCDNSYDGYWVLVYLNGNIRSNRANVEHNSLITTDQMNFPI
jgi:hypothetical protein